MRLLSRFRSLFPVSAASLGVVTTVCLYCMVVPMPLANGGEIVMSDDIILQMKPKPRTRGIASESTETSPGRVVLPAIQFEIDSARFTRTALTQVQELGKALKSDVLRTFMFAVQGHTDSTGSSPYNRGLSLRRARAVTRYLKGEMGVVGGRLIQVGLGESFPIDGIPATDARNRRVEITKLGGGAPAEDVRRNRRRALLIGIDKYGHVSPLKGPVNDAKDMANFITGRGGFRKSDVRLLLDAEATKKNILAVVKEWLVEGTNPGDEVFLFYSGHGFQQPDLDGDETDGLDETLVPVDAFVNEDGKIKGMITDDELGVLLARLSGRRVRVVVDACHSGTSTRSVGGSESWKYVKTPRLPDGSPIRIARTRGLGGKEESRQESLLVSNDPDFAIWTAVRSDQKALVDREVTGRSGGGSVYTRRLLWGARDGKADENRDGIVTMEELHRYVLEESEEYCKRYSDDCRLGLTPQVQVASGRLEVPAFGNAYASLPRNATLAKDILVRPSSRPASRGKSNVRLRIDPGSNLVLGANLDIIVESDRKGYLVLLDINAAGELVQIFPNEGSLRSGVSSLIRPGEPVRLPGEKAGFRFRATPPAGSGLLVAVVTQKNDRVWELASRHKDLSVVPSPAAYLVEIGEALRAGSSVPNNARGSGWSVATLQYKIALPDSGRNKSSNDAR